MQTKFITNELCYETAGIPSKKEICNILSILLDNTIDFDVAYAFVGNAIKSQGYSLSIILNELLLEILTIELNNNLCQIISDLSDLENMVTKSTFGDIYITSLIGLFKKIE